MVKPVELANTDIELVLTTDGQVDKIKADSLDKAIDEIKDRIKKILKDNPDSKESAARVKALKQALADIEKSRGNLNVSRFRRDGDSKAEEKKVIIRKIEDAKQSKLTAEKKAQIDKAKARVEALRNELMSTQKKLHEAEMDFIKMKGDSLGSLEYRPEVHTRIEPVQVRVMRREDLSSSRGASEEAGRGACRCCGAASEAGRGACRCCGTSQEAGRGACRPPGKTRKGEGDRPGTQVERA